MERKYKPMSQRAQIQADSRSLMQRLSTPETDNPPWDWLQTSNVVFMYLIAVVLVGTTIAQLMFSDLSFTSPSILLLGWVVGNVIALALVWINRRSSEASRQALKLDKLGLPVLYLVLIGVAFGLTVDMLVAAGGQQFSPIPPLIGVSAEGAGAWLLGILLVVIVRPIVDEIVFRGVLLPKLRYAMGPWRGLIISALIYGGMSFLIYGLSNSLADPARQWYGLILPFVLGFGLSLVRVYTDSTRASIVAHMGAGMIFVLTALVLGS